MFCRVAAVGSIVVAPAAAAAAAVMVVMCKAFLRPQRRLSVAGDARQFKLCRHPRRPGYRILARTCKVFRFASKKIVSETDDNGNALFQSYLSKLFKKETG